MARTNLNFLDYSVILDKELTEESVYQQAIENSGDLVKLKLFLENANHAIAITKNQLLPELDVVLSYEKLDSIYKEHPVLNNNNARFKLPQDNLYVGLQFKMPIANIVEKAKIKEIHAQSKNLGFNKDFLEKELKFITREKFTKLTSDSTRLTSQGLVVELHKEIAEEARTRYQNSEMSIIDFFDYEENFRQSQIQLSLAQFNQKLSGLTLEVVQGTLLESYNINILN